MQVPEMRTFYTQKQIITLGFIHRSLSHPRFISVQSLRNPQFLRFNHDPPSTGSERKLSSGAGNGWRVFTAYDSLTGRVVSQRGPINALNPEAGSDSGEDGGRTYLDEGERTYGNVRKAKSAPRLNFDRRVAGERAFQKGSSVDGRFGVDYSAKKGKSPSFWVCSNCGHREGQKWESCRECKSTGTMDQVSSNDGGGNVNRTSGFGVSGNRFQSYGRGRTYGSAEKASVVGGYGSDFSKERAFGDAKKESFRGGFGEGLNSEELVGNKKSLNDVRELQVSENSVFPSVQNQGGEVHPQPMMVEKVTRWTSRGVSDDDFIDGRISENVNTSEDISGEKAATFAENDSSIHGFGKELTSEAVQGNKTSGLEVSENAVYSSHPKQVSDALPSPLMVKQELDLTFRNEVHMGLPTSGNEINGLDGSGTEGSVKRSNWVHGSVSSSGVDEGVKDSSKERAFRVVEKGSPTRGFGQEYNVGDVVTKKKKGKSVWVCSDCGHNEGQWWGLCKSCNSVGTMTRFSTGDYGGSGDNASGFDGSENAERSWLPKRADQVLPLRLTDVNLGINKLEWRIPLSGSFGSEVARVLGGGLVPGSLVLVGGDPGVGKSTLLLQLAAIIAEGHDVRQPGPVVYVSGEESVEQIGNRADRMEIGAKELFLYSGTDIEDILGKAHLLSPRLLIVDSIQTVYLKDVTGSAGGLSQVKECTSALLRYSKKTNVPVLLIGHVTKTGDIAGPRVLEHIVDVVLYFEGEKCTSHRLLRSIKNRFGSTDELGVFEMSQSGLLPVANPSEMYLTEQQSDSEFLVGLAVAVIMDGTRSFLIEIQALCVSDSRGSRHFNGVHDSRANMIIAVLTKQACLKLQEGAIFLNVVSGVKLAETAGDLAIAAAICSSFLELPIPTGFAFIGEIGLSGELRGVPRMDIRVNTVAQLGYKKCIVPKSALKSLKGLDSKEMEVIGCTNLKQVISMVFTTPINQL